MSEKEAPVTLGLVTLFRFSQAQQGHFLHHVAVLGTSALIGRDAESDLDAAFVELFALEQAKLAERVSAAWRSSTVDACRA